MKNILLLLIFIMLANVSNGQQEKTRLDYQYFRDMDTYYAFELYTDKLLKVAHLNFISSTDFTRIVKITIKSTDAETKLNFKFKDTLAHSDNAALKKYAIVFDVNQLYGQHACEAKIIFTLNNGELLSLPIYPCRYKERLNINF